MSIRPRAPGGSSTTVLRHDRLGNGAGRPSAACGSRTSRPSRRRTGEILGLVGDIERTFWNIGPTSEPPCCRTPARARLARSRAALGAGRRCDGAGGGAAAADESTVRRIVTFDDHLAGLEIMLAADSFSPERRRVSGPTQPDIREAHAPRRAGVARRARRRAGRLLCSPSGAPHGCTSGGATLPEARGRGCYRALVRARWDEAMALGLPGLAVQAQYGSSAPILRRLGFVETATVHTLRSPAARATADEL